MKIISRFFVLFFAIGLFTACSDDENEVKPDEELKDASFAFDAQNPPVEIPTALQSSDNQEAATIAGYLASVNSITTYTAFFDAPEGAEVSSTPISAGNTGGRVEATEEDVVVYTWSYTQNGETITYAYQVSEDDDYYYFEYFIKQNDDPYISVVNGAASKGELKEGYLEYFSESGSDDYLLRYEWSESPDGSFVFNYFAGTYKIELNIAADGSGTIDYYSDGVLFANYTWNAAGTAGTYTYYDGQESTTIEWTA